MAEQRRKQRIPPIGARVRINVANIFENRESPIWIMARVEDVLSTQFLWRATGAGDDREGIAFYAHFDEIWRYADEDV